MNYKFKYLLLVVLFACEKEVPLGDLEFEKQLVLNAFLEKDSVLRVGISRSVETLETPSQNNFNDSVHILLKKDGLVLWNQATDVQDGVATIPYVARSGSTYEIQVAAESYPSVLAIDSVPNNPGLIQSDTILESENSYEYKFDLMDPQGLNKYRLQLITYTKYWDGQDSIVQGHLTNFSSKSKKFISNFLTLLGESPYVIFDDLSLSTRETVSLNVNKSEIESFPGRAFKLEVRLSTVSETFYNYNLNVIENTHVYGGPLASNSRENGNVVQGLGVFCFFSQDSKHQYLK